MNINDPTIHGTEYDRLSKILSISTEYPGKTEYQIVPKKIAKLSPANIKPLQYKPDLFVKESKIAIVCEKKQWDLRKRMCKKTSRLPEIVVIMNCI